MSKYRVRFHIDSCANAFSLNEETIDLVEDWNYTEEEAQEIFDDDKKMEELFTEWKLNVSSEGWEILGDDE